MISPDLSALKARNIDELTSGYQIDFIGKDYAKKQAGEKSVTVIVPDVEHNTLAENKNSHNLFLTGDNLDVLRHLQNNYADTVDMIYIDPLITPDRTGLSIPIILNIAIGRCRICLVLMIPNWHV